MTRVLGALVALVVLVGARAARPEIDRATRDWLGARVGVVSVAFVDREGVAFGQAGRFAPDDARTASPDTAFEIGSVSKLFVGILLAESERAGKVRRDDAAAKYLLPPDDPAQAALAKITLVSLATHSAGLPGMASNFRSADGNRARFTRAQLLEGFRRDGATAEVGVRSAYSNFSVVLLGQALAAAWGGPYPRVLQANVLDPLGLAHTWCGVPGAKAPEDFPSAIARGKIVAHWEFQADALAPSGSLRSTARDLALFLQACLGQRETAVNASIQEAMKPLRIMGNGPGKVGLNWMSTAGPRPPIYWHNGATAGFRAFLGFDPAAGTGVAVLFNCDAGEAPETLGFALLGRARR